MSDELFIGKCRWVRYVLGRVDIEKLRAWQEDPREAAKYFDKLSFFGGLAMKAISILVLTLLALTLSWKAFVIGSIVVLAFHLYVDSVWRCPYAASDKYRRWAEDTFEKVEFKQCSSVLEIELWASLSQEHLIAHRQAKELAKNTTTQSTEAAPTRRL